jgi:hypothetical protein
MSNISGNTSSAARIIVVNESDWLVENNSQHSSGNFSIQNLAAGTKTIIARAIDGECYGYGNVSAIQGLPVPFTQDFSSSIDSNYWTIGSTTPNRVYTTNGVLRLYVGNAGARVTDTAYAKFDKYTVSGDFQTDVDFSVYQSDERDLGSGWNAWEHQFRATIDSTHWFGSKVHWTWRSDHGGDYWGFKIGSMAFYQNGGSTVETPYPSYLSPAAHPAGTYRIERTGSLWTLKYKIGGTWYTAVSNINIGAGDLTNIMINAYDYNHEVSWTKLIVDFDNFKINYGIID